MWWFECRDIDMVSRLASAVYHMSSKEAYYEERRKGCSSSMSSSCRSHLCRHHFRRLSSFHDRSHSCHYRCCHFSFHHPRSHPQHHFAIVVIVVIIIIVLSRLLSAYHDSNSRKLYMMKDEIDCHSSCIFLPVICFVVIILVV